MIRPVANLFCCLILAGFPFSGNAGQTEPRVWTGQDIAALVTGALELKGYQASPEIAPERVFFACDENPSVTPMFKSWGTVSVTCQAPRFWRIAVRTNLGNGTTTAKGVTAESSAPRQVVFLRVSLKRGEVIGTADVELRAVTAQARDHYFSDIADVLGRRMSSALGSDRVLLARHLQQRTAIEKGMRVTLEINSGALRIATAGEALEAGQLGELIRVRNKSSGRIVIGEVSSEKKL